MLNFSTLGSYILYKFLVFFKYLSTKYNHITSSPLSILTSLQFLSTPPLLQHIKMHLYSIEVFF